MIYHIRRTAFTLAEGATHVALLDNYRKNAFTLAEVLITLGVIGVVAAMTLPSLITKINNRGYAERLIKTYSVIQNATNKIIEEEGDPANWSWSNYQESTRVGNDNIVNLYKKNLSVAKHCVYNPWGINDDCSVKWADVKYLNGSMENVRNFCGQTVFTSTYPMLLADGVYVGISFAQNANGGGVMWGHPDIAFTIDVNGKKGPNQIGRDIFYLYMDKNSHGKVLPYTNEVSGHGAYYDFRDTCDVTKTGHSCAYRVISEGKMNY